MDKWMKIDDKTMDTDGPTRSTALLSIGLDSGGV